MFEIKQGCPYRQMLSHTAGLPNYGDLIPPGTTKPLTDKDVLNLVEQQDTAAFKPEQRFEYSNTAYSLLSLIVEKVSGISYNEFIKQRIFKPLGMTNSTLNVLAIAFETGLMATTKKVTA